MKKLISVILALAMLMCAVPLSAVSEEAASLVRPNNRELIWEYYIDPMYAGMVSEGDLSAVGDTKPMQSESFANISEAGDYIRRNFANRVADFEFTLKTPCSWDDVKAEVVRHTGNPLFGDSIRCQSGCSAQYNLDGTYYRLIPTYYTTAAQEAELTEKVNKVMAELNLSGKSDYEKVCAIYEYICKNVVYDYDHLGLGNEYLLMYTAYAALVQGTSVCQGYAVLFYRMCLEAGVDNRVITGYGNGGGHAWNIVKLGDLYYNCDSTWDAGFTSVDKCHYFLKGSNSFYDHERDEEYNTAIFNAAYPTSTTDYGSPTENICTVTFDSGTGGRVSQETYTIEKGKSFAASSLALPYAAKANGILNGWYDDPVNGTKLESTTAITESKTYYARWDSSIDNPVDMTLTDIKGRNMSTKSENIKTVFVFGCLTSCWNTRSTMGSLCKSEYVNRKDVRVIFVQIKQSSDSRQTIEDFIAANNCGDNFYFCDYSREYNRLNWQYVSYLLGSGVSSYTMPFIVVMNDSDKCVFAGTYNVLNLQMVYDSIVEYDEVIASGYCGGEGDGTNLTWVLTDDGTLTISGNGKMADYGGIAPWGEYKYSSDIVAVKFNGNVTSIGDYAFNGCSSLTSITIPNSVTSLGECAFEACGSLTSIEIPNSVASVGNYAFLQCYGLTSIEIPDSVTNIGRGTFCFCFDLVSVAIPNSVTSIGGFAFSNCSSLASIEIPNSVTDISECAFDECISLTSITIPNSVMRMGGEVFSRCRNLSDIYCEAKSKPSGWDSYWNYNCSATVHWGYGASAVIYGDVDGDGKVTAKDRVTLARYIAGWDEYKDINEAAADVDNDGRITAKDRVTLARHIAGWEEYKELPYTGK